MVELTPTNNNVWEHLVSQYLHTNGFPFKYGTWKKFFFFAVFKKLNPYCSAMFKRLSVMLPKFHKCCPSIIFRVEGYCKHSSCTLNANIFKPCIQLKEDLTVSIVSKNYYLTQSRWNTSKTNSRCWKSQTQCACMIYSNLE